MPSHTRYDLEHVTDPRTVRPTASTTAFCGCWNFSSGSATTRPISTSDTLSWSKMSLFSGILVAANEALLEISEVVDAPREDRALIEGWIERGRAGLEEQWDSHLGLCLDQDVLAGELPGGYAPWEDSRP